MRWSVFEHFAQQHGRIGTRGQVEAKSKGRLGQFFDLEANQRYAKKASRALGLATPCVEGLECHPGLRQHLGLDLPWSTFSGAH